jgi:thioredoxin reductase (NADPH)
MSHRHSRVLIVGAGPAGYTAAIYAARAMLEPTLIAGIQIGGQLTITTEIENYPGFAEPIQGPWLVEQMRLQAENCGTTIVYDTVTSVDLSKRPFTLVCDSGAEWSCDALIVATGAQARWLGLPSEEAYRGHGVSACATCDGFFYRGKEVVVVGGGNTAVEEALYLTHHAAKVTVIHRRDAFRAERILQNRLFENPKVEVIWNARLVEVLGDAGIPPSVTGVRIQDVRTDQLRDLACDGVFVAIGHAPAVELFRDQLKLKPSGYLWTAPHSTATSIEGVFAAGDVADEVYRQAVTAAGMGCMAALEVEKYLAGVPAPAVTD